MESRVSKAIELHKKGYNCTQSVVCAYCDLFGLDEETSYRMVECLGLGMGVQEVCGAVSGAMVLAGYQNSLGTAGAGNHAAVYKADRLIAEGFREMNSTIICRELKGGKTGKVIRGCNGCIKDACLLVEKHLLNGLEE